MRFQVLCVRMIVEIFFISDLDGTPKKFLGESSPRNPQKKQSQAREKGTLPPSKVPDLGEIHSFMGRDILLILVLKQVSLTLKSSMTSQRHHKFTLS